jgi:hypothetical protein
VPPSWSSEEDDVAEILFLAGIESMEDVYAMSGDGSWGPCGQIPKSKEFKAALQSPDHDFRHTLYISIYIISCYVLTILSCFTLGHHLFYVSLTQMLVVENSQ